MGAIRRSRAAGRGPREADGEDGLQAELLGDQPSVREGGSPSRPQSLVKWYLQLSPSIIIS